MKSPSNSFPSSSSRSGINSPSPPPSSLCHLDSRDTPKREEMPQKKSLTAGSLSFFFLPASQQPKVINAILQVGLVPLPFVYHLRQGEKVVLDMKSRTSTLPPSPPGTLRKRRRSPRRHGQHPSLPLPLFFILIVKRYRSKKGADHFFLSFSSVLHGQVIEQDCFYPFSFFPPPLLRDVRCAEGGVRSFSSLSFFFLSGPSRKNKLWRFSVILPLFPLFL